MISLIVFDYHFTTRCSHGRVYGKQKNSGVLLTRLPKAMGHKIVLLIKGLSKYENDYQF